DVRTRLLETTTPTDGNGNALLSFSSQKKKFKGKSTNRQQDQSSSSSSNSQFRKGAVPKGECTYCWKRLLPSRGHQHSACTVLAADKQKKNSQSSSGSANVASAQD